MRLHSIHVLRSQANDPNPIQFELQEVLPDESIMLLRKGNRQQTHYSREQFEQSFIPVKAASND